MAAILLSSWQLRHLDLNATNSHRSLQSLYLFIAFCLSFSLSFCVRLTLSYAMARHHQRQHIALSQSSHLPLLIFCFHARRTGPSTSVCRRRQSTPAATGAPASS